MALRISGSDGQDLSLLLQSKTSTQNRYRKTVEELKIEDASADWHDVFYPEYLEKMQNTYEPRQNLLDHTYAVSLIRSRSDTGSYDIEIFTNALMMQANVVHDNPFNRVNPYQGPLNKVIGQGTNDTLWYTNGIDPIIVRGDLNWGDMIIGSKLVVVNGYQNNREVLRSTNTEYSAPEHNVLTLHGNWATVISGSGQDFGFNTKSADLNILDLTDGNKFSQSRNATMLTNLFDLDRDDYWNRKGIVIVVGDNNPADMVLGSKMLVSGNRGDTTNLKGNTLYTQPIHNNTLLFGNWTTLVAGSGQDFGILSKSADNNALDVADGSEMFQNKNATNLTRIYDMTDLTEYVSIFTKDWTELISGSGQDFGIDAHVTDNSILELTDGSEFFQNRNANRLTSLFDMDKDDYFNVEGMVVVPGDLNPGDSFVASRTMVVGSRDIVCVLGDTFNPVSPQHNDFLLWGTLTTQITGSGQDFGIDTKVGDNDIGELTDGNQFTQNRNANQLTSLMDMDKDDYFNVEGMVVVVGDLNPGDSTVGNKLVVSGMRKMVNIMGETFNPAPYHNDLLLFGTLTTQVTGSGQDFGIDTKVGDNDILELTDGNQFTQNKNATVLTNLFDLSKEDYYSREGLVPVRGDTNPADNITGSRILVKSNRETTHLMGNTLYTRPDHNTTVLFGDFTTQVSGSGQDFGIDTKVGDNNALELTDGNQFFQNKNATVLTNIYDLSREDYYNREGTVVVAGDTNSADQIIGDDILVVGNRDATTLMGNTLYAAPYKNTTVLWGDFTTMISGGQGDVAYLTKTARKTATDLADGSRFFQNRHAPRLENYFQRNDLYDHRGRLVIHGDTNSADHMVGEERVMLNKYVHTQRSVDYTHNNIVLHGSHGVVTRNEDGDTAIINKPTGPHDHNTMENYDRLAFQVGTHTRHEVDA